MLPKLIPHPPTDARPCTSKVHADGAPPTASSWWDHDGETSSARQWELQMEAAAEKVHRLNKKIHGISYVEPVSSLELDRLRLKNRDLRAANRELKAKLFAEAEGRRLDSELDALSDEESDAAHLRERRRMREKLEHANEVAEALRAEVTKKTHEIAELRVQVGRSAPGPNNVISQMRAINMEQLRVHSARQARELERTKLDLHVAMKALLHPPGLVVAQGSTKEPQPLDQVVVQLAKSEKQRQQLINEKRELEHKLERVRSDQLAVDARKKLNALHKKSAAQEANVLRARRALDECNEKRAQHAIGTRAGAIESTRQRTQEQQRLEHCRFRFEAELSKLKELQVQVRAAELLLHEKCQLGELITMVENQAAVIEQLQTKLELEDRFNSRYLDASEGEAVQSRDVETTANTPALDQLRHQIESELGALSTISAQLSDSFSGMATTQGKYLAGQLERAIGAITLIGRLQDEMIGLTATVEVEQRSALHKLRASTAKARGHEGNAAKLITADASVQVAMDVELERV